MQLRLEAATQQAYPSSRLDIEFLQQMMVTFVLPGDHHQSQEL
jgi:hypothetical protein